MKQYIMGMLTGASLILCAFMFMGNAPYQDSEDIYYKLSNVESTVDDIESIVNDIESTVDDIESDVSWIKWNGVICNWATVDYSVPINSYIYTV